MNYKWVKGIQQALEFKGLGLKHSLAVYLLCDLRQVIQPLCVCFGFYFPEMGSCYTTGLELTMETKLTLNLRSSYFCLPSTFG